MFTTTGWPFRSASRSSKASAPPSSSSFDCACSCGQRRGRPASAASPASAEHALRSRVVGAAAGHDQSDGAHESGERAAMAPPQGWQNAGTAVRLLSCAVIQGVAGQRDAPRLPAALAATTEAAYTTRRARCVREGLSPFAASRPIPRPSPRTRPTWLKALPWLTQRRCPAPISSAPRNSRASRSCSKARTPPARSAEDTPRRRALDAALAEIEAGREEPSIEWRREYSLMLGLERVLADEEPKLVDGTMLSAHQVDALSGTLIALTAEQMAGSQAQSATATARRASFEELPSGEVEIEGDDELSEDDEPLDWDRGRGGRGGGRRGCPHDDPGAARRFWFEHATGAGKTVAALGFVEASRTGGVLILTHRRNLVDQFNGELRDRGYRKRVQRPLLGDKAARRRGSGHRRDLPVVRAQRGQDLRRLHDRDLRRGPHRARREDHGLDPPVAGPGLRRHDRHRRADRPPRHRPLPHPDLALRPGAGRPPRRDRARCAACASRRAWACARSPRCRCARARSTRTSTRKSWPQLLDQTPFNLAIADLYKVRFKDLPGVVYTAGVRHAHNVAEAFMAAGHQGQGRVGRDAQARAHARPGRLRARRDRRALQRPAAGRGLELTARHRLHAPRAHRVAAHLPAARGPRDAPHSRARRRASSSTSSTRPRPTTTPW